MAFAIGDFGDGLVTGTVKVRGKDVPIRALSDLEQREVSKVFEFPRKPLKMDVKGQLVPDDDSPIYRAAMVDWTGNTDAAQAAVMMGLELGPSGVPGAAVGTAGFAGWVRAAATALRSKLSGPEIARIVAAGDKLVDADELAARAEKN